MIIMITTMMEWEKNINYRQLIFNKKYFYYFIYLYCYSNIIHEKYIFLLGKLF